MINQQALESLFLATYLEDYFDSCENLPDDVQKQATRMRELDVEYQKFLKDVEHQLTILLDCPDVQNQSVWKLKIQHALMSAQDKGDEKLQITQQIQDYMDNKVRQLDLDLKNLGYGREHENDVKNDTKVQEAERPVKRARRARHEVYVPSILGPSTLEATSFQESACNSVEGHPHSHRNSHANVASAHNTSSTIDDSSTGNKSLPVLASSSIQPVDNPLLNKSSSVSSATEEKNSGIPVSVTTNSNAGSSTTTPKKQSQHKKDAQEKKYKKRKKQSDNSPPNIPIDPDEPTYCLCDQVSYGEMIGCDNDLCPIEWFHFSCVQLNSKPKGKWYCPKCRGDRPNIMKPKAIFLKELEKYNREKEEKS